MLNEIQTYDERMMPMESMNEESDYSLKEWRKTYE